MIHKRQLLRWFDGMAWFMQIALFITLACWSSRASSFLSWGGVEHVSFHDAGRPSSERIRQSHFLRESGAGNGSSVVGLGSSADSVCHLRCWQEGKGTDNVQHRVFVSLTSVAIQGTTIPLLRETQAAAAREGEAPDSGDIELSETMKSELMEIELMRGSYALGKRIVDLGFPKTALISLIKRRGKFITPSGSTVLEEGDMLLVISESKSSLQKVYGCLKMKWIDSVVQA